MAGARGARLHQEPRPPGPTGPDQLVLLSTFRLPTQIHTRSANAKWLDELAHTNPVWIHPADAERLGVARTGDLVRVETDIGYFVAKAWITEGIRPGVVACSHHMGRWRLDGQPRGAGGMMATVDLHRGDDGWAMRRQASVAPYASSDPDSQRIWWSDTGVHQNLTFAVHPDPISGMHCWHQAVWVRPAGPQDRHGDIAVDTSRARADLPGMAGAHPPRRAGFAWRAAPAALAHPPAQAHCGQLSGASAMTADRLTAGPAGPIRAEAGRAEAGPELLRALGSVPASPPPHCHPVTDSLGLPAPTAAEHTSVFVLAAPPHAAIHLGADGKLGGEALDRVAGFWRAIGLRPPQDADHLGPLLMLYAELTEAETTARLAATARPAAACPGGAAAGAPVVVGTWLSHRRQPPGRPVAGRVGAAHPRGARPGNAPRRAADCPAAGAAHRPGAAAPRGRPRPAARRTGHTGPLRDPAHRD